MVDEDRIRRALAPALLQRRLYGGGAGLPVRLASSGPAARRFTPLDMQVLLAVALDDERSNLQLADDLLVDKASVGRSVGRLAHDGLLEGRQHATGGNRRAWRLTGAGEQAVERFVHFADEQLEQAEEG